MFLEAKWLIFSQDNGRAEGGSAPPPFAMLVCASLLFSAALASAIPSPPVVQVREPKVTLPFVARLNVTGRTIADIDRARAASNIARASGRVSQSGKRQTLDATNQAVDYIAEGESQQHSWSH